MFLGVQQLASVSLLLPPKYFFLGGTLFGRSVDLGRRLAVVVWVKGETRSGGRGYALVEDALVRVFGDLGEIEEGRRF
jgi:hypothetical protein